MCESQKVREGTLRKEATHFDRILSRKIVPQNKKLSSIVI